MVQMNLSTKQKQRHRCRKQSYGYQGKNRERDKPGNWGWHTPSATHKTDNEDLRYSLGDSLQYSVMTHVGTEAKKESNWLTQEPKDRYNTATWERGCGGQHLRWPAPVLISWFSHSPSLQREPGSQCITPFSSEWARLTNPLLANNMAEVMAWCHSEGSSQSDGGFPLGHSLSLWGKSAVLLWAALWRRPCVAVSSQQQVSTWDLLSLSHEGAWKYW